MKDYVEDEDDDIKYGPPSSSTSSDRSWSSRVGREQILPKFHDEKPMIGPQAASGKVQVLYKSSIDGYMADPNDIAAMEKLGLPTGFEFGNITQGGRSLKTKKDKKTFYCNTCKLELNSEDTLKSHMQGSKHMKKVLADQAEGRDVPQVQLIANPKPTRKKQPIRLQEKIHDSVHKIVGLSSIREYIACSDSEMEPWYECHLCEMKGQANCMFQHIIGKEHRQNFVSELTNNDPTKISLSQAELLTYATDHNENDERVFDRIQTTHSDDLYPWPPGKEPWLIENGGSGIIPDSARTNFGKTRPTPSQNLLKEERKVTPSVKPPVSMSFRIPFTEDISSPKSSIEMTKMLEMGQKLLFAGMEFHGMKSEDKTLMKVILSTVQKCSQIREQSPVSSRRSSSVNTSRGSSASNPWESGKRRDRSPRGFRDESSKRSRRQSVKEEIGNEDAWESRFQNNSSRVDRGGNHGDFGGGRYFDRELHGESRGRSNRDLGSYGENNFRGWSHRRRSNSRDDRGERHGEGREGFRADYREEHRRRSSKEASRADRRGSSRDSDYRGW